MLELPGLPRFHDSAFFSVDAIARRPLAADGALSQPAVLRHAVASRSFRQELILLAFDFCAIADAINAVLLLRHAGFEHFVPLADGEATCAAMRRAAPPSTPRIPCYWSNFSHLPGWKWWGSFAGCVSATHPRRSCVIEQMQAVRYHVAGQLLGAGANLLFMDLDTVLLQDPYVPLKQSLLAGFQLIFLRDTGGMPANGGLWYAHGTHAGAGAQWVVAEVARRTEEILRQPVRRKWVPPSDQALFCDALATATNGGDAAYGLACEHRILREMRGFCSANRTTLPRRKMRPHLSRRSAALPSPYALPSPPGRGRVAHDEALAYAELRVRGEARVERVVRAPNWLFPRGWDAQRHGVFEARAAAVVHLLGVRCRWCLASEDTDHGAKWEWQQLSGMWSSAAYLAATPLHQRQLSDVEKHCARKGRARLLYRDRPLLAVSPALVRAAEARADDGAAARVLIQRLLSTATLLGRMAVLPSFNCSALWIRRGEGGRHVADLRVVVVAPFAGRPVHEQRCAPCNVQFQCREHVLSEAQAHAATGGGEGLLAPTLRLPALAGRGGTLDSRALWGLLRDSRLGSARLLQLDNLLEIEEDGASLDEWLLRHEPRHAMRLLQLLCGMRGGPLQLQLCPRSREQIRMHLRFWASRVDASHSGAPRLRHPSRSLVGERLGERCADLLCAETTCREDAIARCGAGLSDEGETDHSRWRPTCELWVSQLPASLGPVCDGLRGKCIAPPEAHPHVVMWPSKACANHASGSLRPGDSVRLCSRTTNEAHSCVPCVKP